MTPAVEFSNVTYKIGGQPILRDLSLSIPPGETLVLLGRSGSGKTTALKLINALLLPSSGEVRVGGKSTASHDPIRLRRGIGYVIQEVGLFPHFTVARNVGLVPELEGWDAVRIAARVKELLDAVGLPEAEFSSRHPSQLSGGQRQRVGIARALAGDPPILLFDEPFGALDPVTRIELQDHFLALRARMPKTTVFVTHDVHEALRLATRIALLDEGRLQLLATPREFLAQTGGIARRFLDCLSTREVS
jgi:ABC-type proline/glycine betaine transport systems, ATPase components